METPIRVIITGTTGMVGEGVLHECLQHPAVAAVLVINRKSIGITHAKLTEVIHADFFNLSAIEHLLSGYNACFFCLGVSSVGMNKDDYYKATYTLTMHVGTTFSRQCPGMTFCYISGAGTDSTEQGSSAWARVKGKTENDLMKLPFQKVYAFRPGFIKPTPGLSRAHSFYKYVNWLFPVGRALYPAGFCTLTELGHAMINIVRRGYTKNVIEGKDIIELSKG
jgi:uncharacterized protein YbjT (DUF2867 family)